MEFPINYPTSVLSQLQGYFAPLAIADPLDPLVYELALETSQAVDHNTSLFLTALSQRIYTSCTYQIRETGSPLPAGITWRQSEAAPITGSLRQPGVLSTMTYTLDIQPLVAP